MCYTREHAQNDQRTSHVKPGVAVAVRIDKYSIGEIVVRGAGYVIRSID